MPIDQHWCRHCPEAFTSRAALGRHERAHGDTIHCGIDNCRFSVLRGEDRRLQRHQRRAHQSPRTKEKNDQPEPKMDQDPTREATDLDNYLTPGADILLGSEDDTWDGISIPRTPGRDSPEPPQGGASTGLALAGEAEPAPQVSTGGQAPPDDVASWPGLVPVTVDPRIPYGGPAYPGCRSCRRRRAARQASDFAVSYQEHPLPQGIAAVLRTERCTLPDGSSWELTETWVPESHLHQWPAPRKPADTQ